MREGERERGREGGREGETNYSGPASPGANLFLDNATIRILCLEEISVVSMATKCCLEVLQSHFRCSE